MVPIKTDIPRGELFLIPHYGSVSGLIGDPERYVLARFDRWDANHSADMRYSTFLAESVKILLKGRTDGKPNMADSYESEVEIFRRDVSGIIVFGGRDIKAVTRGETFVGLEEMFGALNRSRFYIGHSDFLAEQLSTSPEVVNPGF